MKAQEIVAKLKEQKEAEEVKLLELKSRLDRVETTMNRPQSYVPQIAGVEAKATNDSQEYKAWQQYLWSGHDAGILEAKSLSKSKEGKALSVDEDVAGGYVVPPFMSNRIIELRYAMDPLRGLASVTAVDTTDIVEFVAEYGTMAAGWVAERGTRNETGTMQLLKRRIPTHAMYAYPKATSKALRLANWDLESWIARKVAQRFAFTEGQGFITGTGVGQPEGITTNSDVAVVNTGDNSAIDNVDCLISMQDTLLEDYQPNACWIMSRATKAILRQMKDGVGRYILDENVATAQPDTFMKAQDMLLGKPVHYMPSMPVATVQNNYPIVYGDIMESYMIVDNPVIAMVRDNITTPGFVKFNFEMDVGGGVINPAAIIALKIST